MGRGIRLRRKKEKDKSCALLLKVLADETRLEVLQLLMSGPKRVGEINEVLDIDQSLLSHHLRILRDHELVISRRDGKGVLYHISPSFSASRAAKAIDLGCCVLTFE